MFFDRIRDPQRFVLRIRRFVERDGFARAGFGPEPFADALGVVRDHAAGGFEDGLGGAVVLLQANGDRARKIALEVEDIPDIGPAPAVDGLVLIAHYTDILA